MAAGTSVERMTLPTATQSLPDTPAWMERILPPE